MVRLTRFIPVVAAAAAVAAAAPNAALLLPLLPLVLNAVRLDAGMLRLSVLLLRLLLLRLHACQLFPRINFAKPICLIDTKYTAAPSVYIAQLYIWTLGREKAIRTDQVYSLGNFTTKSSYTIRRSAATTRVWRVLMKVRHAAST